MNDQDPPLPPRQRTAHDAELIDFVRELVPQLNILADRLERFVERTEELPPQLGHDRE